MRVIDIMHRDVITVNPDSTLFRAAEVLHDKHISALVVVKGDQPVGIVTGRTTSR